MNKIKFITDSACDIPQEILQEHNIDALPLHIIIDEQTYLEGVDIGREEYYEILKTCSEIPKTSAVSLSAFMQAYEKAWQEGFTDIVVVTLTSQMSATYQSSVLARELFFSEHPEAKVQIHTMDSENISICYGVAVVEGAQMVKNGEPLSHIIAYLENWFAKMQIYFLPFSLDVVKKAARINTAVAFLGQALSIRPLICLTHGNVKAIKRVHGKKNFVKEMFDLAKKNMQQGKEYIILHGENLKEAKEFADLMLAHFGHAPKGMFYAGPVIATTGGYDLLGFGFQS